MDSMVTTVHWVLKLAKRRDAKYSHKKKKEKERKP